MCPAGTTGCISYSNASFFKCLTNGDCEEAVSSRPQGCDRADSPQWSGGFSPTTGEQRRHLNRSEANKRPHRARIGESPVRGTDRAPVRRQTAAKATTSIVKLSVSVIGVAKTPSGGRHPMVTNTFFDLIFLPLCRQLAVWFVLMAVGRTLLISAAQLWHRLAMTAGKGLSGESASGKGYAAAGPEARSPRTPLHGLISAPDRPRDNNDETACRACWPGLRQGQRPGRLVTHS
jgi:hypothetical protein